MSAQDSQTQDSKNTTVNMISNPDFFIHCSDGVIIGASKSLLSSTSKAYKIIVGNVEKVSQSSACIIPVMQCVHTPSWCKKTLELTFSPESEVKSNEAEIISYCIKSGFNEINKLISSRIVDVLSEEKEFDVLSSCETLCQSHNIDCSGVYARRIASDVNIRSKWLEQKARSTNQSNDYDTRLNLAIIRAMSDREARRLFLESD